jgi:hypothetical protein
VGRICVPSSWVERFPVGCLSGGYEATLASQHCTYTAGIRPSFEKPLGASDRHDGHRQRHRIHPSRRPTARQPQCPGTPPATFQEHRPAPPASRPDPAAPAHHRASAARARTATRSTDAIRCPAPPGGSRAGNGLAFGAAAGTLHPSPDPAVVAASRPTPTAPSAARQGRFAVLRTTPGSPLTQLPHLL